MRVRKIQSLQAASFQGVNFSVTCCLKADVLRRHLPPTNRLLSTIRGGCAATRARLKPHSPQTTLSKLGIISAPSSRNGGLQQYTPRTDQSPRISRRQVT